MFLITFCFSCLLISQGYTKSIDQKITEAYEDGSALDFIANEEDRVVRVELDILMKMDDYDRQQWKKIDKKKGRNKRKAILPTDLRWTNKEIPYSFSPLVFSLRDRQIITEAIDQWNNYTCLNFRPATWSDRNKIRFQTSSGCSSYIGMIGGAQGLNLAPGCRYGEIVVHELGHAVGFYHEQSRTDRDSYVEIITDNIINGLEYNFEKAPDDESTNLGVPYDYLSVMHYDGRAFGVGGAMTIRTLDPAYQDRIGNAPGLSFYDIRIANLMYNCNEDCPTQTPCPGEGFQGKDCNCYCPKDDPDKPIRLCDETDEVTTQEPGTTDTPSTDEPPPCIDRSPICPFTKGVCGVFVDYMTRVCPLTCDRCPTTPEVISRTSQKHVKRMYSTVLGNSENASTNHQGSVMTLLCVLVLELFFNGDLQLWF